MFHRRQGGLSLVLSLFIIVVLGLLSRFLLQTLQASQRATAQEVLSTRALQAAESGINIAAMNLFPVNGDPAVCLAGPVINNYNIDGLRTCQSEVSCRIVNEASKNLYIVDATGICGATPGPQARRLLRVTFSDIIQG